MAWKAVVWSGEVAKENEHQMVEREQNIRSLESTDEYYRQPKVIFRQIL